MSNVNLRSITNVFLDVRLVSLKSWRQANEFSPRDHGGPYVVLQDGYDPNDVKLTPDEFVLGRSGKWLSLRYFFQLPLAERRQEFVFGTAAEVIQLMGELPSKLSMFGRPAKEAEATAPVAEDEMAAALKAAKSTDGPKA